MKMNKYLTLSLVAAGLSVSAAGVATASDTSTQSKKSEALFKTLDADQDGQLTAAEMAKLPELMRQRRFDRLDSNGDGKIDQDEYAAHFIKRAERRLARLDKNGDGTLSADELTRSKRQHGHNSRSSARHGKHHRGRKPMSHRHGHSAKRGYKRHMRGTSFMFARLDRNNDGYVSAEEWQQAHKRRGHHHTRHHGHKSAHKSGHQS